MTNKHIKMKFTVKLKGKTNHLHTASELSGDELWLVDSQDFQKFKVKGWALFEKTNKVLGPNFSLQWQKVQTDTFATEVFLFNSLADQ